MDPVSPSSPAVRRLPSLALAGILSMTWITCLPAAPVIPHGPRLDIPMTVPAAAAYSTEEAPPASPAARAVRLAFSGLTVSRRLSRAAAAYARALPQNARVQPPMAFVEFVLHWAGCPDPSATATVLYTTEDGPAEAVRAVRNLLAQPGMSGTTHIGVARVPATRPPYRWRWGVVAVHRLVRLPSFPARVDPGATLPLQFELLGGLSRPRVILLRPDGTVKTLRVGRAGALAVAAVDVGPAPGTLWIEIVGDGPEGPEVTANFPVAVGRPPARAWSGFAPPDESTVTTPELAESLTAALVNQDRSRFGLAALALDRRLAAIARAHSRDMAEHHYFGHTSPTAGGLAARLAASGYQATWSGENIARASSVAEAEAALMRSPGHRANILAVQATRVGIGIVRAAGPGRPEWVVTQIFARPVAARSADRFVAAVRELIARRRRAAGLPPVPASPELDRIARHAADLAAAGRLATMEVSRQVAADIARSKALAGHFEVLTWRVPTPRGIRLPAAALRPGIDRVGIGARRGPRSPLTIIVVILVSSTP